MLMFDLVVAMSSNGKSPTVRLHIVLKPQRRGKVFCLTRVTIMTVGIFMKTRWRFSPLQRLGVNCSTQNTHSNSFQFNSPIPDKSSSNSILYRRSNYRQTTNLTNVNLLLGCVFKVQILLLSFFILIGSCLCDTSIKKKPVDLRRLSELLRLID